ncbi:MAG: YncE family protein, partial [Terriglobia bacterium]
VGDIRTDAHPAAIVLERPGRTIFITSAKTNEVAVIDARARQVISKWAAKAGDPVALALDEPHHRLFVGARNPPRIVVFDSQPHKFITSLPSVGVMDDLFFDGKRQRIYASGGEGFVEVYRQIDPDHYKEISKIPTGPGARTSLFVPAFNRYYVAIPAHDQTNAEIMVFEPQP